ncbi:hypothetical protein [Sulfitobacter sp. R18_1]|uniref:hypothetical protein n=1 Tax=Sulfitobacter sp. R18_1 TaxID=2821104 RepID=UPI001ADCE4A1|nr:hypothetical protein [Sulfitobacter sp. R18_1]MBO9428318.1 hypothetical protein [Sulfitobacter sp. R18_1]
MENTVFSFSQYGMNVGKPITRLPWSAGLLFDLEGRLKKMGIDRFQLLRDPAEQKQGRMRLDDTGEAIIFLGKSLDAKATIDHEAIHILRKRNLFTDEEWDALTQEANQSWLKQYDIPERYENLSRDAMVEEAVAEAYADYRKRADGRHIRGLPRLVAKAFSKIRAVFTAVKRTLRGHGVSTSEALFQKVSRGEIGSRTRVAPIDVMKEAAQRHSDIEQELSPVLRRAQEQPGFWEWSKGNKIPPMMLYHGTTQEFSSFDASKTHPECAYGRGFYFTNTLSDVHTNYATPEGPDLKNKIDLLCEKLADRIEAETGEEADYNSPEIEAEVRESLVSHDGAIIPVFLRMTNPIIIGGDNPTYFKPDEYDFEQYMDEAREELEMSNYDEDPVEEYEVEQLARDRAMDNGDVNPGEVSQFLDSLENISEDYYGLREVVDALRGRGKVSPHIANSFDTMHEYLMEGCKVVDLIDLFTSEMLMDIQEAEPENDLHIGAYAAGEIVRHALEDMGYDGIIDHTVSSKFSNMSGMDSSTTHYIVFDSKNIKSVFNQGTFSLQSDNISYQAQPLQR